MSDTMDSRNRCEAIVPNIVPNTGEQCPHPRSGGGIYCRYHHGPRRFETYTANLGNTVELLGHYGGDRTHAQSAWTSTDRELTPEKAARVSRLLETLAENGHETPFEKSYLHFLVACDTASHIHFLKHRIGVSVNAESARYKELKDDKWYMPDDWSFEARSIAFPIIKESFEAYHRILKVLVESGMDRKRAKESARFVLPYANQLTLDVGFNFRSFVHFQRLRNKPDAQKEIREIAQKMLELVRGTGDFNCSLEAFKL